jgi:hypothetical protein
MSAAYRSSYEHIVGSRVAEIRRAHEALAEITPQLFRAREVRVARAVAGAVGVSGAVVAAAASFLFDDGFVGSAAFPSALLAMVAVYVAVRIGLGAIRRARRPSDLHLPALTGTLEADLEALRAIDPRTAPPILTARLERWSLTLPLAAISLLTPLTLHFLVACAGGSIAGFSVWARISVVIVGHAHLTLVALAVAFGRKLARSSYEEIWSMSIAREWAKAFGVTIAVSCLPGIVVVVPPVLAAITGITFIPAMFIVARRCVLNERALIEHFDTTVQSISVTPEEALAALDR